MSSNNYKPLLLRTFSIVTLINTSYALKSILTTVIPVIYRYFVDPVLNNSDNIFLPMC